MSKVHRHYDLKIRRFASVLYRVLLVIICCFLPNIWNAENAWAHISVILTYFVIYLICFKKKWSTIRLICDFLFILYFSLAQADANNFITYTVLCLPIINNSNFSGERRSNLLFFLYTSVVVVVFWSTLTLGHGIALASVFLILQVDSFRRLVRSLRDDLNDSMDRFLDNRISTTRPQQVYREFLAEYGSNWLSGVGKIQSIICYRRLGERWAFMNSSEFIFSESIQIPGPEDIVGQDRILHDVQLEVNGVQKTDNTAFLVKLPHGTLFAFVFVWARNDSHWLSIFPGLRESMITRVALLPVVKRMSRLFQIELDINLHRTRASQDFKKDHDYMLKAIHALHFVKGKLSPVLNYIEASSEIFNRSMDDESRRKAFDILHDERLLAYKSINDIVQRAEQIMSSDNPLNVSELETHPLDGLVVLLRAHVAEHYPGKQISFVNIEEAFLKGRRTKYNEYGLNVVLSELVYDIEKYSVGNEEFSFNKDNDNNVHIVFQNATKTDPASMAATRAHVSFVSSDTTEDIFKLKSLGGYIVKKFLRQMNIAYSIDLSESGKLTFTMSIKTHAHEVVNN